jgi:thiol:disulfide interchange protein DsbD
MKVVAMRMIGCIMICLSGSFSQAQRSPVSWSFEAVGDNNNGVNFVAKATIEKGWYIYNLSNTAEGPIATQVKFDLEEGQVVIKNIDVKGNSDIFLDPIYHRMVSTLKGFVQISQKITDASKKGIVKGHIVYMACDKSKCLPPASISFDLLAK